MKKYKVFITITRKAESELHLINQLEDEEIEGDWTFEEC